MRLLIILFNVFLCLCLLAPAAFGAPPGTVENLAVNKSGEDINLSWSEATTDIYNNSVTIVHYNIYRGTSADFVPDLEEHANRLDQTTGTSYTDTGALLDSQSYFYYVTAVNTNGQESLVPSNLGCRLYLDLAYYSDSGSNTYWLALPQNNPYANASDLDAASANISQVISWDAANQTEIVWNADGTGTDFSIEPGKAYGVTITTDTTLDLVGSYEPISYDWSYNSTQRNAHWISLPRPTGYQNASDLAADIPETSKVARYDTQSNTYQSWFYLDGQWMGEDFDLSPENGIVAAIQAESIWMPRPASPHGVTASVSQAEGHTPCTIDLNGSASDRDGSIASYQWDVDGDGTFDKQSTDSPAATAIYDQAGTYYPTLLVTDDSGLTGYAYETVQVYSLESSFSADAFLPAQGETLDLNVTVSDPGTVSIRIYDSNDTLINTVATDQAVQEGSNTFQWDGTNDSGQTVNDGAYYAVFEYSADGTTYSYSKDLRTSSGGSDVTDQISDVQASDSFSPVEGEYVDISYTLQEKSKVTIVIEDSQGQVLRTLLDQALRPSGSHTETWDGSDDSGTVIEPGSQFFVDITAESMADNAIIASGNTPVLSDVTTTNARFSPSANPYGSKDKNSVTVAYSLNKEADIHATITNENGQTVRTIDQTAVSAGANELSWNGRNNDGILCTDGFYTMTMQAVDSQSRQSNTLNLQVEVFY